MITAQSFDKVRSRQTTDGPHMQNKKGHRIKIGGHISYDYPTNAVVASFRGEAGTSSARAKGSFDAVPVESGKRSSIGNPPIGQ